MSTDPSPDPRPFADLRAKRDRLANDLDSFPPAIVRTSRFAEFGNEVFNQVPAVLALLEAALERVVDLEATLVTCDPAVYIAEHKEAVYQHGRAEAAEGRVASLTRACRVALDAFGGEMMPVSGRLSDAEAARFEAVLELTAALAPVPPTPGA